MGFPNRIAIATHGYRCGGTPVKTAIATEGYRCLQPVSVIDPFGGGKGHGAVIVEPYERLPSTQDEQLAILAVLAIMECDNG